jgi:hypothetical protein
MADRHPVETKGAAAVKGRRMDEEREMELQSRKADCELEICQNSRTHEWIKDDSRRSKKNQGGPTQPCMII